MKAIIAGGRRYVATPRDFYWLSTLLVRYGITEVVSGGANGADAAGERWAAIVGVPVRRFVANWIDLGRHAGPARNQTMARYVSDNGPGMVVLFPGGQGTESMRKIARSFKLPIIKHPRYVERRIAAWA